MGVTAAIGVGLVGAGLAAKSISESKKTSKAAAAQQDQARKNQAAIENQLSDRNASEGARTAQSVSAARDRQRKAARGGATRKDTFLTGGKLGSSDSPFTPGKTLLGS